MDNFVKMVQVLSVVTGVVISVLSITDTRQKEADARKMEADARKMEATRPFLELRQKTYIEAVKNAAIISTPADYSGKEVHAAKRRFRELYVTELSMVEAPDVEARMVELARQIDPELLNFSPAQSAAYKLALALQKSFVTSWGVNPQ